MIELFHVLSVLSLAVWLAGVPLALWQLARADQPLRNAFTAGMMVVFVLGILVAASQCQTALSIDHFTTRGLARAGVIFQRVGLLGIAISYIIMLQYVVRFRGRS